MFREVLLFLLCLIIIFSLGVIVTVELQYGRPTFNLPEDGGLVSFIAAASAYALSVLEDLSPHAQAILTGISGVLTMVLMVLNERFKGARAARRRMSHAGSDAEGSQSPVSAQ